MNTENEYTENQAISVIVRFFRKTMSVKRTNTPLVLVSTSIQSKDWRKSQKWYEGGRKNECEKFQRISLETIIGTPVNKTIRRFNMEHNEFTDCRHPYINANGFEYTEDFDGNSNINGISYYFNMKFCCETGGAQTRTLKDVYHFIRAQAEYLIKSHRTDLMFINILDGAESYKRKDKFDYLMNNQKYIDINIYIFIGGLIDFQEWWLSK
jgi:hypothetical protein